MASGRGQDGAVREPVAGPVTWLVGWWFVGLVAGHHAGSAVFWLVASAPPLVITLLALGSKRHRVASAGLCLLLLCVGGGWYTVREQYRGPNHIARLMTTEPQLANLIGIVADAPRLAAAERGPFAAFDYKPPTTFFVLAVEQIEVDGRYVASSGQLLVQVRQADHRLKQGMRIAALGWMAPILPPKNPGEFDYRAHLRSRGIYGRLSIIQRGNWRLVDAPPAVPTLSRLRTNFAAAALSSLRIGLEEHEERLAFLQLILLGKRTREVADAAEQFRNVGLAHLLSLSGAHLGILLGLVWLVVRLLVSNPPRAALIVFVVLLLYLMAVPLRVPIVRAGVMAGVFCIAYMTGRRIRRLDLLAVAALIVLLWQPGDLMSAGFQLSFGVVAALMVFTERVSEAIHAPPLVDGVEHRGVARFLADYAAVNLVSFAVALPLVSYHFQLISPLTVLLSFVALPVVVATLGFGYLKIAVGLLLPSAGIVAAVPLAPVADIMLGLVDRANTWPGATLALPLRPTMLWTAVSVVAACALLAAQGRRGRLRCGTAYGLCFVWLWLSIAAAGWQHDAPLRLHMIAVGNGACIVLDLEDPADPVDGRHIAMFDCGSGDYLDVGGKSIVPALRRLGVEHVDTLILSHTDLDHYSGVVDLLEHFPVHRVVAGPSFRSIHVGTTSAWGGRADNAEQFLASSLVAHGHASPHFVMQGETLQLGGHAADVLWPPAGFEPDWDNDESLMLLLEVAGRRVLLTGDVQRDAMEPLLASDMDLRADVCELPHHGSFVRTSRAFIERVSPMVVLQSSGPQRLREDKWRTTVDELGLQRFVTHRDGMISLTVKRDGAMLWQTFKDAETRRR